VSESASNHAEVRSVLSKDVELEGSSFILQDGGVVAVGVRPESSRLHVPATLVLAEELLCSPREKLGAWCLGVSPDLPQVGLPVGTGDRLRAEGLGIDMDGCEGKRACGACRGGREWVYQHAPRMGKSWWEHD
jgi:hypothetical protein